MCLQHVRDAPLSPQDLPAAVRSRFESQIRKLTYADDHADFVLQQHADSVASSPARAPPPTPSFSAAKKTIQSFRMVEPTATPAKRAKMYEREERKRKREREREEREREETRDREQREREREREKVESHEPSSLERSQSHLRLRGRPLNHLPLLRHPLLSPRSRAPPLGFSSSLRRQLCPQHLRFPARQRRRWESNEFVALHR
jgi:hypothetical protein